ncbi:SMP-30/gluconolactonase/LRE family protein [Olivibacter sitiensis]|uniref:SMP-30/gluconolactonase/LRE family protein n=1 Tax=Olivibacter sitiensis TaxID=376470 RepID=UPI00041A7CCC|nr:SMP-30/gluconolactonase/LRE family protein [Olivibacter sitiensis]
MSPFFRIVHITSLLLIGSTLFAQEQGKEYLSLIWKTDSILPIPESILLDKPSSVLYVSLIGKGDRSALDGNGSIGKLKTDGTVLDLHWATGLNSPKGIDTHADKLFVADLKELVVIDLKNGKTINKFSVPEAGMLNDVTSASNGSIYVSDSNGGSIYKFQDSSYVKLLDNLKNPNGLLVDNDTLYYLDSGSLYAYDLEGKSARLIAEGMLTSTDGLQKTKEGDFLISCWIGSLYFVKKDGKVIQLQDSRDEKKNTADITFDSTENILYVPTFLKKSIEAYRFDNGSK